MCKKYNLMVLENHPVTYRLGIYELLSKNPHINLKVLFISNRTLKGHNFSNSNKKINRLSNLNFPHKFTQGRIVGGLIKNRPDAIIIYGYQSTTHKIALMTAKILGIPIIFRDEIDFIDYSSPFAKKIKKIIFPALFKLPSAFLYSYTRSKEFYLSQKVSKKRLFFHPCAVNNDFFQKQAKKGKRDMDKIKKKLGIPQNSKVILYVGRIEKRKRVRDILNAYKKLDNKKDTYLIYVGNGTEEKNIKKYSKSNNLNNVKIFNSVNRNELYKFYSIADLFVIASDYDPSPKVLNEAMNFSLPVIVSNKVGTAPDLIKQGKNGFIFKCKDIDELAKNMEISINDKKLREKMGKESLKIISKWNFDEDVKATIKALDYIYDKK